MSRARQLIAWMGALCVAGAAWTASAAEEAPAKTPPEKTTTVKPPAGPSKVIPNAIAALRKEYAAYQKDPKQRLREKCDYFKENPAELTPAEVLKGLETAVTGDPALIAYVKWQLLSGLPAKFPDDLEKRALAVYRSAPEPGSHPGMNHRALSKAASGARGNDVAALQKEFDGAVEKSIEYNAPILAYRDELYARLPSKPDVFAAGFADVADRSARGMPAGSIFDTVSGAIRSWAIVDAKPGQAKALAGEVSRIKDMVTKADKPFSKLTADAKAAKWGPDAAAGVPVAKFDDLLKFLTDNSSPANGGGLKFKDK